MPPIISFTDPVLALVALVSSLIVMAAILFVILRGYPQGDELVQNTNPYYQTAYALVTKSSSPLDGVDTLALLS
jgi:hypothetical protein